MATILPPPIAPDIDDRPQRMIRLSNGLVCLLISDMNSLISAAAMTVGCGQMDDPPEVQGLAHFTEHMVFLGSDKCAAESLPQRVFVTLWPGFPTKMNSIDSVPCTMATATRTCCARYNVFL
jgi:predicted Zn-dependent peptidase